MISADGARCLKYHDSVGTRVFATIPLSVIHPFCGGFNEKLRHIPLSGSRGKVAVAVVVLLVVVAVV